MALLVASLALPVQAVESSPVASGKVFPSTLKSGSTGDFVSDLQNILKSDTSIYPEGLVTGYFGKLTEEAVKKLQKKYGLPETGVVDDTTQQIIFPNTVEINVVTPNGGESWDKKDVHNILWKSTIGPVTSGAASGGTSAGAVASSIAPFFPRASIDLIKDSDVSYRYHITTVSLYQSQYPWKIPGNIQEASDYRVRISTGGDTPCVYRMEGKTDTSIMPYPCPLSAAYPIYSASDTSDNPFAVTGTMPPSPEIIAKLKAQVAQIENALNNLLRQVQELKSLIESL